MPSRIIVACLAVLTALPVAAQGAYVEYQGAGGSLAVASDWYVITDPSNPSSTTGTTRLPTKYVGTYPGTPGDTAILRNSTTTTLYSTLNAQYMSIGGPAVTGQPTRPATNVYIPNGGTLSMYSDDPFDPLYLNVGEAYPATLNMIGGTITINPRRGGGMYVGATGTGVLNMSSGTVRIQQPAVGEPSLVVGYNGGTGQINQTGGLIALNEGPLSSGTTNLRLGAGGYGEYNLSGGAFDVAQVVRVGHEYDPDPETEGDEIPGTGVLNITGGTFEYGYRIIVGDGNRGDANVGHIRFLGGTVQSNPAIDPNYGSHLWVGRGAGSTATPGAIGKITVSQDAVIRSHGLLLGRDGYDAVNSRTEVKINSYGDFDAYYAVMLILAGDFEVSLTDGFRPTAGTEWRLATTDATSDWFWLDILKITPGFHLEKTATELFLVCDSLMQPGDANNDGFVDVGDLGILAFNWGQSGILGKSWTEADFTGDDLVDVGNLGVLAFNWGWSGTPAGAGNMPEPASLALLVMGGLAMLRRRRE